MTSLEKLDWLLNARGHVCLRRDGAFTRARLRLDPAETETHCRDTVEGAIDLLYDWTVEAAWKKLRPCENDLRQLGVPVQCEVPVATPSESKEQETK